MYNVHRITITTKLYLQTIINLFYLNSKCIQIVYNIEVNFFIFLVLRCFLGTCTYSSLCYYPYAFIHLIKLHYITLYLITINFYLNLIDLHKIHIFNEN